MTNEWPTISIPDIRNYDKINADLVQLLDAGHTQILLSGAERQRLLAFRLRGGWKCRVVIDGECGPEVGAELDAPFLTIVCRGNVGDGSGRSLRQGRLVVLGSAGAAVGMNQLGGRILVKCSAGPRAGLRQAGGDLIVQGSVGRLASERRTGGRFLASVDRLGPHFELGRTGGASIDLAPSEPYVLPGLDALLKDTNDPFAGLP